MKQSRPLKDGSRQRGRRRHRPNPPRRLLAFDFIDPEHGWVAFGNEDAADLLDTADGGQSWSAVTSFDEPVISLDFTSLEHGWLATEEALVDTADGGRTWNPVAEPSGSSPIRDVLFIDGDRGWLVYNGGIITTLDGGSTWSPIADPCTLRPPALTFVDALNGWAGCGGVGATAMQPKQLYRTTDAGQDWQLISCACFDTQTPIVAGKMPWRGHLTGLSFFDETHARMSSNGGGLDATTDGALSWKFLPTGVDCGEEFISASQLLSPKMGYVIAEYGAITRLLGTRDGGSTWSSLYPSLIESCSTPELRASSR